MWVLLVFVGMLAKAVLFVAAHVGVLCVCVSEICSQPHYWANLQASEISEDYFVAD